MSSRKGKLKSIDPDTRSIEKIIFDAEEILELAKTGLQFVKSDNQAEVRKGTRIVFA